MESSRNKAEQLRALKKGKGIQYLLNEAYRILQNPILVHDMEYTLISYAQNVVTDDPIWNEFITTGTVSKHWLEFYKNESFLDTAANSEKITFLLSDKLKYDRIFSKLINREGIQIGCCISVIESQSLGFDYPMLFELFCDILNAEIARSEYYRNYGQAYQESLINKLIDESIEDREIYAAHVESIYMNLKPYLYLAVAHIAQFDSSHGDLASIRDLFKRSLPGFKYSVYDDNIVIIMSFDDPDSNVTEALNKLKPSLKQYDAHIGISSCFDNLFELRNFYDEALKALNYVLKHGGSKRILPFDEIVWN